MVKQNQRRGRPRLSETGGRQTRTRTQPNIRRTFEEKYRIITYYEAHGMPQTLEKYFSNTSNAFRDTARKLIYTWLKSKESIKENALNPSKAVHRSAREKGVGTSLPYEVEDNLVRWVCDQRTNGIPVTHSMLREKALEAAKDIGISQERFRAGESWIHGFKQRHGLDRDDARPGG